MFLAIFLDIETTGLDATKHHAIDIGCKIVDVSSGQVVQSYQSVIKIAAQEWELRDPASIEINGYTWEEILQGKERRIVGQEIIQLFQSLKVARGQAVFICQNPAFDRAFFCQLIDVYTQEKLNWPYHWLDLASMYWMKIIQNRARTRESFPESLNLSKNEIAKAHGLPIEVEPHRAIHGVDHLILCYQAVLEVKFQT